MNRKALVTATSIGLVLQVTMILAGHFVPFIRNNVFAVGGMTISLVAGLIYARAAKGGWADACAGGAAAGGVCAILGIAASVVLKDTAPEILAFGTVASAITGLIGGVAGRKFR